MALTVTDLRTTINSADSTSGWTGSASPTLFGSDPDPVEGSGCLGMVVSNATQDAYFTLGSALNLVANPELIYVWIFHRAVLDTTANGGIGIQLGDGTNRVVFHLAGSDVDGFRHAQGPVGWQCIILDPTNLPSAVTVRAGSLGNLNLAAITQIGVGFKTLAKAQGGATNCFWDIMRRGAPGQGLRISGGTSGDPGVWQEIADTDRSEAAGRAHGIVRRLGAGVFGVQGYLTFGDEGSGDTFFDDTGVTVVYEDRGLSNDMGWYGLKVVGGTGETVFRQGAKVGDEGSTDGCVIAVPPGVGALFDASHADLDQLLLYGTRLAGFADGVNLAAGANGPSHELIGCNIDGSGRLLSGRVVLRQCVINGTVEPAEVGAYRWDDDSNVRRSSFTNNLRGIVFEALPSGGEVTWNTLLFSGNTFDVRNDSGGALTINVVGGGDSPSVENIGGSTTDVLNPQLYELTGIRAGSSVVVVETSPTPGTVFLETTVTDEGGGFGSADFAHNGDNQLVDVLITHLEYVPFEFGDQLTATNKSIPINQQLDRVYANPEGDGGGGEPPPEGSYKQTVLDLNPVHFVHDNLIDEAGPNDLTAVGSPTRVTTGTPGDGIPDYWTLNGTNQHLEAADHAVFDITGEHTVVWWVRRTDDDAQINSANQWAKGDTTYQTRLNGDAIGQLRYDVRGGTGGNEFVLQTVLALNEWMMIVARYGGGFMQLIHVDDSDDSLVIDSTVRTGTLDTNSQRWTVGVQNDTGDDFRRWWRGDIVPPIIFDYRLSEAEILSIWESRNEA